MLMGLGAFSVANYKVSDARMITWIGLGLSVISVPFAICLVIATFPIAIPILLWNIWLTLSTIIQVDL